jgi:hypothetical protein
MISSPCEHVERVVWCSSRATQLSHRTASASLAALGAWKQEGAEVAHRFLSRAGESDAFDPATQDCNLAADPGERQVSLELAGTPASCAVHGMAAAMQRWSALNVRLPPHAQVTAGQPSKRLSASCLRSYELVTGTRKGSNMRRCLSQLLLCVLATARAFSRRRLLFSRIT